MVVTAQSGASDVIVSAGARWKYLDDGSNQETAWQGPLFDDGTWKSGVSHLGYGDATSGIDYAEETVLSYGLDPRNKYITYYFRKAFYVSDAAAYAAQGVKIGARINRDDGAVIYLNGVEAARTNMPKGTITYLTKASTPVEDAWVVKNGIPSNLVNGWNVIAAEVHQSDPTSSDISFDLELRKATPEICDGYDNDIDGTIDNGFPSGSTCTVGSDQCMQTGVGICTADGSYTCTNLSTIFPLDQTAPQIQAVAATPSVLTGNNHNQQPLCS